MSTFETLVYASFLNRVWYQIVRSFEDGDINADRRRFVNVLCKRPNQWDERD